MQRGHKPEEAVCFKLMNPTVRHGQSYLNPGMIWLHTYLDKRLTVTQTQRMDLVIAGSIPKGKATLSSNTAQHDAKFKKRGCTYLPAVSHIWHQWLIGRLGGLWDVYS